MWICALLLSPRVFAAEPSLGDAPPLTFLAGPRWDMESGVRSIDSLRRMLSVYDELFSKRFDVDETTVVGKGLGLTRRAVQLLLLDLPMIDFQQALLHEVFGHGARFREAGISPNYGLNLPMPYGLLLIKNPQPSYTLGEHSDISDVNRLVDLAGIESEFTMAYWVMLGMVQRDGEMHYSDLMAYGFHKMNTITALSSPFPLSDGDGWGDTDNYVLGLQYSNLSQHAPSQQQIGTTLGRAYLLNYVDPTLWLAAFHGVWTYGIKGETHAWIPMLRVGEVHLYPGTRFNLSPFGAEHYFDVFARWKALTCDIYGRVGSSGLAPYAGGGGRAFGVAPGRGLHLGGEFDLWVQPQLYLETTTLPQQRPLRGGGNLALHVDWSLYKGLGITGKIGGKTGGYGMGLPANPGPYGYFGLSFDDEPKDVLFRN